MSVCDHKFVDSKRCLKCWWTPPRIGAARGQRIVIVKGPRCGGSWLARALRKHGFPTYCGDPIDKVKEPEAGVTYLDPGMGMESASSRYIVDNWLPMPGPWVLEGHIMARVLRKWLDDDIHRAAADFPCDLVVVFHKQHPDAEISARQVAMHKGVIETTWRGIADYFEGMTFEIDWSSQQFEGRGPEDLARLILASRT